MTEPVAPEAVVPDAVLSRVVVSGAVVPEVVVHRDRDALVSAVADRLTATIEAALAARDTAHVVLTGGGVGTAVLAGMRGARVDWSRVHLWWGDERFLPAGDAERNETQARAALLDHVAADPSRVHAVPPAERAGDPEAAAAEYARQLAGYAVDPTGAAVAVPPFDVLLLGVGDDGHVASLFPGHPGAHVDDLSVTGVRGAPKPPPERVSLTFPAIRAAREVWLLVSGGDKARAVALALSGAGALQFPAAGATGSQRTVWLIDEAAAAQLPPDGLLKR